MKTPPLLPSEVLARTMRLGRMNGMGVLVIAGAGAVACAVTHDVYGAVVGLLVAMAGTAEIHGAGMIGNGNLGGMRWLIASQFYLLVVIFVYCYLGLTHIDIAAIKEPLPPDAVAQLKDGADQMGMSLDRLLVLTKYVQYGLFAFLTLLYQGGMMILYARRGPKIAAALHEE